MIKYQPGNEIEDRQFYADLLKETWGPYGPADVEAFERRITNARNGIIAMRFDDKPAAILETLRTFLAVDDIESFDHLTGDGTWRCYDPRGSNLVMVDLTVAPCLKGKGLSKIMIMKQLPPYLDSGVKRFVTLSPSTARELHEKMGARAVREIRNGRPDYKEPDVVIMEYPEDVIRSWAPEMPYAERTYQQLPSRARIL